MLLKDEHTRSLEKTVVMSLQRKEGHQESTSIIFERFPTFGRTKYEVLSEDTL